MRLMSGAPSGRFLQLFCGPSAATSRVTLWSIQYYVRWGVLRSHAFVHCRDCCSLVCLLTRLSGCTSSYAGTDANVSLRNMKLTDNAAARGSVVFLVDSNLDTSQVNDMRELVEGNR